MQKPIISIVEEYKPELDTLSPKFKTMNYPGVVIVSGTEMIIFSFDDLDILFNQLVAVKAKRK